jgi:hypothetical protein
MLTDIVMFFEAVPDVSIAEGSIVFNIYYASLKWELGSFISAAFL